MRFPRALNLAKIGIELFLELGSDKIPHRFLQDFFNTVAQQTRWNGIDRQEPALQIVDTQQVLAMLD